MDADVVVSRGGVLADRGEMLGGIRAARDRFCDLVLADELGDRLEVRGERQLPRQTAFHSRRGPLLARGAARRRALLGPAHGGPGVARLAGPARLAETGEERSLGLR